MITFRKVREYDLELNSKIEDLNIKVFRFNRDYLRLTYLGELLQGSIRRLHRHRG